jgi:hypothetical protein
LQAVHRQHNTAADAAGLSPRGGCRAGCAQLPDSEGPGASTSRVADRGWCFGTVAWFRSLCVWAALAGLGSPHWHLAWRRRWCGYCGLVARSGRRVLRRLSPVASLWGWVACALWQPHGLSGSRVGGASEGAVVAAGGLGFGGQGPQARGQLATVRHAHRVSTQLKPTQQASGLFLASVARKPSPALTQPSAGGVCKQPAQPVANEDAEHARFSDSRLLSRGRANCWKSVH